MKLRLKSLLFLSALSLPASLAAQVRAPSDAPGKTGSGISYTQPKDWTATSRGAVTIFAPPYEALVGACTGAGAIAIIGWLGELAFKKEAMGFGDVTMMAAVGAALGPERALLTVIVGAFVGALASVIVIVPAAWVLHRRRLAQGEADVAFELPPVPFGVFLAPAALLTLLWGDRMIALYFATVLAS